MDKVGADPTAVRTQLEEELDRLPRVTGLNQAYLSSDLNGLFNAALKEAEGLKDEFISTEHLFLAILSQGSSKAADILKKNHLTRDKVLEALKSIRGSHRVTDQNPEEKYQALTKYGRDLTDLAVRGKLDPVIGRDDEIRRVVQVLSRRTKNNPVLIGEPGVGKTAIAEGLAQRIASGDVPEGLMKKKIIPYV